MNRQHRCCWCKEPLSLHGEDYDSCPHCHESFSWKYPELIDPDICDDCGGRFDRPGLHGCRKKKHAKPDLAQRIVAAIEKDFTNRRGLRQEWEGIDDETQVEIRDTWAKIVRKMIRKSP